MVAPNPNFLCEYAKRYYYDFLFNESHRFIPASIISHIEQCQHCQEQMNQLKGVLSQAKAYDDPEQELVSSAVTIMLKLHFACIGKRVTCNTVKPFLPGLLDPAFEIRIPTPITAHLDNCRQCPEDLETIRSLDLNRKQLCRLSQFLAEKPTDDSVGCSQARVAILAVATMTFHETNSAVLKHLCTCPNCRKALYQYRESVRADLLRCEKVPKEFPCESVSVTDIFDYIMPYGLDPADDQYAKFRQSLSSHLRSCPTCLGKMQELHRTTYHIAERPESEVVTIYHIDESAKAQAVSESDDLYAGFPINVEIANREDKADVEQPVSSMDFTTALKQKISTMNLKPWLKTGIAVAAVILIGLALLLNTPTAKAVNIELKQIYEAIERAKNVYISSFVPDKTEPIQERWISRTLNIYMLKTGKELFLWDIPNGTIKIRHVDNAVPEIRLLPDDRAASVEKKISGSLGLMRFDDISEIPPGAEWGGPVDDEILEVAEGVEVYDLKWADKAYDGSVVSKKWRVFVDSRTKRPQRTEFHETLPAGTKYELKSFKEVRYLSNSEEIQDVKNDFF